MFVRFSQMATVSIALVLGAGTYLAIVRLPHLHDLWSTGYGRVLLVKLGLVNFALLWGAFHKFVVLPALQRADVGFLTRIGRSLLGESLVGACVLLAAAVLVDSKPPPRPQPNTPKAVSPAALGGGGPSPARSARPRAG
jgi:copper transport protein